jgi:hypothetical protein
VVVADEVLGRRDHALLLRAAHEGRPEPTGEIGVLTVRLEDAARARIAHQVESGSEQPVAALGASLPRDRAAHARRQVGVPGCGDRDRGRERGGAVGVPVEIAPYRLADPVRAVGGLERRHVQAAIDGAAHLSDAVELRDLLVERHGREQVVGRDLAVGPRRNADAVPQERHQVVMDGGRPENDGEGDEDGAQGWPPGGGSGGGCAQRAWSIAAGGAIAGGADGARRP